MGKRLHERASREGLSGVHARPDDRHDRDSVHLEPVEEGQRAVGDVRGMSYAFREVRKMKGLADHFALERRSEIGMYPLAHSQHAAHVQDVQPVSGVHRLRQAARVAEQRLPVPQRARDDVARLEARHPPRGKLELVVGALGIQDARDHDAPLDRGDVGADVGLA